MLRSSNEDGSLSPILSTPTLKKCVRGEQSSKGSAQKKVYSSYEGGIGISTFQRNSLLLEEPRRSQRYSQWQKGEEYININPRESFPAQIFIITAGRKLVDDGIMGIGICNPTPYVEYF